MDMPEELRNALQTEFNQVMDLGNLIYTRGHEAGVASVEPGISQEELDAAVASAVAAKVAEVKAWYDHYDSQQDRAFYELIGEDAPVEEPAEEPAPRRRRSRKSA